MDGSKRRWGVATCSPWALFGKPIKGQSVETEGATLKNSHVAASNYMYDAACSARKLDVRSEIKNPWIGKNWIF